LLYELVQRVGSTKVRLKMPYMIAACVLGILLMGLAVVAMARDYDIEISFHPPISFKVKICKARKP
jgi:hypothetical protein